MSYVYFVSFAHGRGFGNLQVTCSQPITSYRDIQQLQNETMEPDDTGQHPVVLSWQLLAEDPAASPQA